ncbi:hypothetical protein EYF80_023245 [Liparis tanakae]|uniref:Uncharacterized protein n=1 Tax=Liparis tanakae TaxID=230148 RepID=A0A4Z2HKZ4_9TELE|nr:hypothetical protein EYF80_023245 [Liparis tanakae]
MCFGRILCQISDVPPSATSLKISDLLKTLSERKSSAGRRDVRAARSTPGPGASAGDFRSRAVFPQNLDQLSSCRFERRDWLRESAAASPPSRESQPRPGVPASHTVIFTLLAGKSETLPSGMRPDILSLQAWTRPPSRGAPWTPPESSGPTGPTSEWFFEDLEDLQRKLFLGASKKSGVPRTPCLPV